MNDRYGQPVILINIFIDCFVLTGNSLPIRME